MKRDDSTFYSILWRGNATQIRNRALYPSRRFKTVNIDALTLPMRRAGLASQLASLSLDKNTAWVALEENCLLTSNVE